MTGPRHPPTPRDDPGAEDWLRPGARAEARRRREADPPDWGGGEGAGRGADRANRNGAPEHVLRSGSDGEGDAGHGERGVRTLRYHRDAGARPMAAGNVILVGLIAFTLGALLNADSLFALASRQPFGWKRTAARGVVEPIRWASHTTRINRPRLWILERTGKDTSVGNGSTDFVVPTATPPQGGGPSPAPPTTIGLRTPTAERPLGVWVGGDSMTQEFGARLIDQLARTGLYETSKNDFHISTGLTRPDYFDWPGHLAEDVLPTTPDVMVIMFGANDAQPMEVDGAPYKVRTPQWQAEYRRRVGLEMDQLRAEGRIVVWVGQPHMRAPDFSERMDILDDIYADEAAKRPWVRFLDSRPVLGPNGRYDAYLADADGSQELARQGDGIHLTVFGASRLATAVTTLIEKETGAAGSDFANAGSTSTAEPGG